MTPARIDTLTAAVNARIEATVYGRDARLAAIKAEILRLEVQVGHLVRFIAGGGESPSVREELCTLEGALATLSGELGDIERRKTTVPPGVHSTWIQARLAQLDKVLRTDPARAKIEIMKHLDGALVVTPRPAEAGVRRAEITGRINADGLLNNQEAVRLELVAGAGFEPATFGL